MNLQDKFENILFRFDICRDEVSESKERLQKVADEFAIEFHKWSFDNVIYYDGFHIKIPLGEKYDDIYTQEELLEIFKKEKGL